MLSKLLLKLSSLGIFCLVLFGAGYLKGKKSSKLKTLEKHNKLLEKMIKRNAKITEQRKKVSDGGRPARSKFLHKNGFVKKL